MLTKIKINQKAALMVFLSSTFCLLVVILVANFKSREYALQEATVVLQHLVNTATQQFSLYLLEKAKPLRVTVLAPLVRNALQQTEHLLPQKNCFFRGNGDACSIEKIVFLPKQIWIQLI